MNSLAEDIKEQENKFIQKIMAEKGCSEDLAKMLFGFSFQSMGRRMGNFPQIDFLSFFIKQVEMLREKDPERANKLDIEFINSMEKHIEENKKPEEIG